MFAVIKRTALLFIISLCIVGLALHFAVESLGEMHETLDSHEEDQFMLCEADSSDSAQKLISLPLAHPLRIVSRPLAPPLQPPKPL